MQIFVLFDCLSSITCDSMLEKNGLKRKNRKLQDSECLGKLASHGSMFPFYKPTSKVKNNIKTLSKTHIRNGIFILYFMSQEQSKHTLSLVSS